MQKLFSSKFLRRTFALYVLTCFIPTLFLSSFFYRQSMRDAEHKARASCEQTAGILCDSLNSRIDAMHSLTNQLKMTNWISRLRSNSDILFDSIDYFRQGEISRDILLYEILIGVTDQIGIYLPKRDMGFTRSGLLYPKHLHSVFPLPMNDADNQLLWPFLSTASSFSIDNLQHIGLSCADANDLIISCSLDILKESRAVLYFFVDGSALKNYLQKELPADILSISMYLDGKTLANLDLSDQPQPETLRIRKESRVANLSITYEVAFSRDLHPGALSAFSLLFTSIVLGMLFSLLLAFLLSSVTYRPIRLLADRVGGSQMDDELKHIGQQYDRLTSERDELGRQLEQYESVLRNQLLVALLHGLFAYPENPNVRLRLSLLPDALYQVIVFKSATVQLGAVGYVRAQMKLNESGLGAELLREEDDWILILEAKDSAALDNLFAEELELLESFRGLPHHGVLGVSKSYIDVRQLTSARYFYPIDWEIQLVSQLRSGNGEVAQRILGQVQEENARRGISQHAQETLLAALTETLLRVAAEFGLDTEAIYACLRQQDSPDGWQRLRQMLLFLCSQVGSNHEDESEDFGESLLRYVNENYRDPNLSLAVMQEVFGCSQPVLSRAFKKAARMTYYDYLSRLRIEDAKIRMQEKNASISRIAEEVGYTSEATFQRAFKRYEGVSPRDYMHAGD